MEIKINYEALDFKPCDGKMVYKDGTTEQIIGKRGGYNQCEVVTPSGQYICFPKIVDVSNGYQCKVYCFGRFCFDRFEYLLVDTIKEFQFYEENKNE